MDRRRLIEHVKRAMGPRGTTAARVRLRRLGVPRWGNLRRATPFSTCFGFERGTPIDRFYLERFLDRHRAAITGDVIEIQVPDCTRRYGHDLRRTDTLDIEPRFSPTYLCDLARSEGVIPSAAYDCFLMPNSLSFFRDIEGCLRQALRIVRPGGVILGSTGGFVPLIGDGPDYWRMSEAGWREIAGRVWPGCRVEIESWGNCLAAVAAMYGLAYEELTEAELEARDPRYPVLLTLACWKPA